VIRVLLADDQTLVRGAFALLVNSADDMEVVGEAGTGDEAVTLTRDLRPDVVLMDIRMPSTDGIEATRQIYADDGSSGTKVLILTTFETDTNVLRGLRAGACGFLSKDHVRPRCWTPSAPSRRGRRCSRPARPGRSSPVR
jgi:DNA-binding NarL/FixJ family response regulator